MTQDRQLAERIATKNALIGVIGLGYVGLPLVQAFAAAGFRCLGFDVDQAKVDKLNAGESYIKHIESKPLKALVESGKLDATNGFGRAGEMDCIVICVPTPLTTAREPDMTYITATAEALAPHVRRGQL